MSDLRFDVTGARVEPYAAVPTLLLGLRLTETTGVAVSTIVLRCQLRIEPQHRRYDAAERDRLADLFGAPERWGNTLQPFLWTHVVTTVPAFEHATTVDLHVEASYELEVAAARYLHELRDGEVPLLLLFSGTVFVRGPDGLRVEQIPWAAEARYRLPVRVWRDTMDAYYPNSGWLRLRRDTIDALAAFKARRALPTWDATVTALLADTEVQT